MLLIIPSEVVKSLYELYGILDLEFALRIEFIGRCEVLWRQETRIFVQVVV